MPVSGFVDFNPLLIERNHEVSVFGKPQHSSSQRWQQVGITGVASTKAKAWVPGPETGLIGQECSLGRGDLNR